MECFYSVIYRKKCGYSSFFGVFQHNDSAEIKAKQEEIRQKYKRKTLIVKVVVFINQKTLKRDTIVYFDYKNNLLFNLNVKTSSLKHNIFYDYDKKDRIIRKIDWISRFSFETTYNDLQNITLQKRINLDTGRVINCISKNGLVQSIEGTETDYSDNAYFSYDDKGVKTRLDTQLYIYYYKKGILDHVRDKKCRFNYWYINGKKASRKEYMKHNNIPTIMQEIKLYFSNKFKNSIMGLIEWLC